MPFLPLLDAVQAVEGPMDAPTGTPVLCDGTASAGLDSHLTGMGIPAAASPLIGAADPVACGSGFGCGANPTSGPDVATDLVLCAAGGGLASFTASPGTGCGPAFRLRGWPTWWPLLSLDSTWLPEAALPDLLVTCQKHRR